MFSGVRHEYLEVVDADEARRFLQEKQVITADEYAVVHLVTGTSVEIETALRRLCSRGGVRCDEPRPGKAVMAYVSGLLGLPHAPEENFKVSYELGVVQAKEAALRMELESMTDHCAAVEQQLKGCREEVLGLQKDLACAVAARDEALGRASRADTELSGIRAEWSDMTIAAQDDGKERLLKRISALRQQLACVPQLRADLERANKEVADLLLINDAEGKLGKKRGRKKKG